MILLDMGRVDEGWALMEEVAAAAVGGELGPYTTGAAFCNVISACRGLADYRRASEWAEVAKRWCERESISGFPGVCRVHRAEVLRLLGSWSEAESELRTATEELTEFAPNHAGAGFHQLGEVRLRMGDVAEAEAAFRQAQELGTAAGGALLRAGRLDAAASMAASGRRVDAQPGAPARRRPRSAGARATPTSRGRPRPLDDIAAFGRPMPAPGGPTASRR
jgi:hypothetical protein